MADNGTLWLRDLAPELIPYARILTYGYDGYTQGRKVLANESIHDLGKRLLAWLSAERQDLGVSAYSLMQQRHTDTYLDWTKAYHIRGP